MRRGEKQDFIPTPEGNSFCIQTTMQKENTLNNVPSILQLVGVPSNMTKMYAGVHIDTDRQKYLMLS